MVRWHANKKASEDMLHVRCNLCSLSCQAYPVVSTGGGVGYASSPQAVNMSFCNSSFYVCKSFGRKKWKQNKKNTTVSNRVKVLVSLESTRAIFSLLNHAHRTKHT